MPQHPVRESVRSFLDFFDGPGWIVAAAFLVVLILSLTGCVASNTVRSQNGSQVAPPAGFDYYCAQHAERAECGGVQ